ncbi:MAG: 16S rRNA (uracil(1498)-N(3))-methyltransferase [Robiginitomaculum sp.]|nr:MAG: 16S rRNA (uracil(1498)-N(3))-methyltransferase [Robiginitomaculum sp.]
MKSPPRLFIDQPLAEDQEIKLDREASHYVVNVMRRRVGDPLRLFDGQSGEWLARLTQVGRKAVQVRTETQSRAFAMVPDLTLLFAPVKKSRSEFIVEKATELGVRTLQSVQTRRTIAKPLRDERLALIVREAAEQTERLDLPKILASAPLKEVLQNWDAERVLIFCDEAGEDADQPWGGEHGRALPMLESLQRDPPGQKAAILIGPEGGFTPEERASLRACAFVRPVTLGPRILRADTAAVAALSLWQAVGGDWIALK